MRESPRDVPVKTMLSADEIAFVSRQLFDGRPMTSERLRAYLLDQAGHGDKWLKLMAQIEVIRVFQLNATHQAVADAVREAMRLHELGRPAPLHAGTETVTALRDEVEAQKWDLARAVFAAEAPTP